MKTVLHKAETRGHANHGWLNSYHTFSFAGYHNPERIHFGALRVLNDDTVAGGMGFGRHPHDNMEIVSIPLSGDLEHQDSMGNRGVIRQGDIQVMSAGSGIQHSEMNHSETDLVRFLQIWMFPNKKNVTPRYGQITLDPSGSENKWQQILSPNSDDEGVWVHQDAWFHMSRIRAGNSLQYEVKKNGNGLYYFVIEGNVAVDGQALSRRDGLGVWEVTSSKVTASSDAKVLLMEVPMM